MSDKDMVYEYLNNLNNGDEELCENDVFVELMLPLAELSNVMWSGEVPSKELIERTRQSMEFFKGFLNDVDNMLGMLSESIQKEEP